MTPLLLSPPLLLFLLLAPLLLVNLAVADVHQIKASLLASLCSSTSSEELASLLAQTLSHSNIVLMYANQTVAVIGGGLSGLTTALHLLLEHDVNVVLLDRSGFLGGDSAKASSGINGAYTKHQISLGIEDSEWSFFQDTLKSSEKEEGSATGQLIKSMVGDSVAAVEWVLDRALVPSPVFVGQLGGHSGKRTHRPATGLSGAAFINGLEKALKTHIATGQLVVKTGARATGLERIRGGGGTARPPPPGPSSFRTLPTTRSRLSSSPPS